MSTDLTATNIKVLYKPVGKKKKKKRKQINWFFWFLPVLTFASVSSYESLKNIQPDACLASCYRQLKDWKLKHHTIKIISFNELYNLLTEVRCHSFLNLNFLFPFFKFI